MKGYGFLFFAKDMDLNLGKNISNNLSSKYSQNRLDHDKKCTADALKTASKRPTQEQQKQLVIGLVIKLLIKLQKCQEVNNRINSSKTNSY